MIVQGATWLSFLRTCRVLGCLLAWRECFRQDGEQLFSDVSEISARISCGFMVDEGFFRLGSGSFSREGFGVSFLSLADGLEGGNGAVGFAFYFVVFFFGIIGLAEILDLIHELR